MCLAQGHNTVTPVRLKPAAPRSPVKHSTISCFENSEDPDQLASEKPADQDPHCFPLWFVKNWGGV